MRTHYVLLLIFIITPTAWSNTYYRGGVHNITHRIHGWVYVEDVLNAEPTTFNLLSGGVIDGYGLVMRDSSILNIDGGLFSGAGLYCEDQSQATLVSGTIANTIILGGTSSFTMLGGEIHSRLKAYGNSTAIIRGGGIGSDLQAGINSTVYIYGDNFNFNFGPITETEGTIKGTLESGISLYLPFTRATNASIILVPEPATLILLALGAMMLNMKKHQK